MPAKSYAGRRAVISLNTDLHLQGEADLTATHTGLRGPRGPNYGGSTTLPLSSAGGSPSSKRSLDPEAEPVRGRRCGEVMPQEV